MLRVYAQLAAASAPIIEASSVWRRRPTVRRCRGRIICTMLECPPRKEALRACRCAGCLIAMADENNSGSTSRAHIHQLSVLQPTEVVRCWPFEPSTVLAASKACGEWPKTATLDTAARDAGRTWPTALAVSG
jgi:hypothetical protein